MAETILLVDDEASVRQTFGEWLQQALPETEVLTATDAESALQLANQRPIDLAILDWNLGSGSHGLQLLEDLHVFQPDLIAILVTGYADKATPLDALRLGVRDYFDKNRHLTRDKFLASIRRQLEKIRPAKRERLFQQQLQRFRAAVERALPAVQTMTALQDTVPLTETVRTLFQVLRQATHASTGLLILRTYFDDRQPQEHWLILDHEGKSITADSFRFASSLAASIAFQQPESIRADIAQLQQQAGLQLLPQESAHRFLLSQATSLGPTTTVVIELFDKQRDSEVIPFAPSDQAFLQAMIPFLTIAFRRTMQEKEAHQLLLEAIGQALRWTEQMDQVHNPTETDLSKALPPMTNPSAVNRVPTQELRLIGERLERLAENRGPAAIRYCLRMLEETERLLDATAGLDEG